MRTGGGLRARIAARQGSAKQFLARRHLETAGRCKLLTLLCVLSLILELAHSDCPIKYLSQKFHV